MVASKTVAKPEIDRQAREDSRRHERCSIHGLFYNTKDGRSASWTCHRLIISGLRRQVGGRLGLLTVLRHKLFAAAVPRVVILRRPRASHYPERATTGARASKDAARAGAVTLRGSARKGARRAPQDDGLKDGVCDAVD